MKKKVVNDVCRLVTIGVRLKISMVADDLSSRLVFGKVYYNGIRRPRVLLNYGNNDLHQRVSHHRN